MPGTGHHLSLERALAQGASPVKTGIAERVKLAADVGYGNRNSLQVYFPDLTRSDVRCFRYVYKCHVRSFGRMSPIWYPLEVVHCQSLWRTDEAECFNNLCSVTTVLAKLLSLRGLSPYQVAARVFRRVQGFVGTAQQRREIDIFLPIKTRDSKARGYGDLFEA